MLYEVSTPSIPPIFCVVEANDSVDAERQARKAIMRDPHSGLQDHHDLYVEQITLPHVFEGF